MKPAARSIRTPHHWLELGLLFASGGAILVVVTWVESALAG